MERKSESDAVKFPNIIIILCAEGLMLSYSGISHENNE